MPNTYADIKARIVREMVRDDLSDDLLPALEQAIASAIEYHADARFWFNEYEITNTTTPGDEYVSLPADTTFRTLDRFAVTVGTNQYTLRERPLAVIQEWANTILTQGQPTHYAVYGDADIPTYRLWPQPNLAYTVTWLGIRDLSALSADSDTNSWLTYGYDLITARAKYLLYRDQFRDEAGASLAAIAEKECLTKIKGETARRLGTGRMKSSW